jgi:hypothetical protein
MVQNAKDYNSTKSLIFEDAERMRKALSNYMPKHNPAYMREGYRPYPTPIPSSAPGQGRESSRGSSEAVPKEKVKLIFSKRRQSEVTPSTPRDPVEEIKQEQLSFLQDLSRQEDAM